MKRKLFWLVLLAAMCVGDAFAAINNILLEAQEMLRNATTIENYVAARKKFTNASLDINYNPAEHDAAISRGINECSARIRELSPRLTVNGNSRAIEQRVGSTGGEVSFKINSTVGRPAISDLPDWVRVLDLSTTALTLACDPNTTSTSRNGSFILSGGKQSVRVNIIQAGERPATNPNPGTSVNRRRELEITDVSFSNITFDNKEINAPGTTLYSAEMQYLCPVISYNGPTTEKTAQIFTRVYDPNGNLMDSSSSPAGFSQGYELTFFEGDNQTVKGLGWGNRRQSFYGPGQYKFELWMDGNVFYTAYVTIYDRPSENAYLTVNGEDNLSVDLRSEGGQNVFFVSTNDSEWQIHDLPRWLVLSNRTENSFTLTYRANTTREARKETFVVTGAGMKVPITVMQAINGPTGSFTDVRIDKDVTVNGEKGLQIHANLSIDNAQGHRVQVVAWFYYETGEPLVDQDGRFRSGDGLVTVNKNIDITGNAMSFPDFSMFIPYYQLHLTETGTVPLQFDMGAFDMQRGEFIAQTSRINFNIEL